MQKKMNLVKFREAMMGSRGNLVIEHLKEVFGEERGRVVMAYLAETGRIMRLEYRIKTGVAFFAGIGATLVVGAIVRMFS